MASEETKVTSGAESLDETLSLLRAALESTADGILIVSRVGKIVGLNAQFVSMWRIPQDVVASGDDDRALAFVLDQLADPEAFLKKVQELYADPDAESYDTLRFKDGRVFERYSRPQVVAGESVGRVWSFRDATERHRTLQALREAKDAAEAANRAKSDFLARMSHEIRTPMNAVIALTELVLEGPLAAKQREHLRVVCSSAQSFLRIINDILDFSKIDAGRIELEPGLFDLRTLLKETLLEHELRAREKDLTLTLDVGPEVPTTLIGDAGRLRQIVTNLVGNALKFTSEGQVVVRVRASAGSNAQEPELLFSVEDSGIGISTERQSAIFEPFVQAETSTTRRYGGTGLGLTISTQLVALMGGRLWLESEPGIGTTFFFTIRFKAPWPLEHLGDPSGETEFHRAA